MPNAATAVASSYDANHLCETLLLHMLDCTDCLEEPFGSDHCGCRVSADLQARIQGAGGATRAAVFAY